jgi:hypothetical protein
MAWRQGGGSWAELGNGALAYPAERLTQCRGRWLLMRCAERTGQ